MSNTKHTAKQSEQQSSFNTHTGSMKKKLEEVGVVFVKSIDGRVWYAEVDGQQLARNKELSACVKEAGRAYGED